MRRDVTRMHTQLQHSPSERAWSESPAAGRSADRTASRPARRHWRPSVRRRRTDRRRARRRWGASVPAETTHSASSANYRQQTIVSQPSQYLPGNSTHTHTHTHMLFYSAAIQIPQYVYSQQDRIVIRFHQSCVDKALCRWKIFETAPTTPLVLVIASLATDNKIDK